MGCEYEVFVEVGNTVEVVVETSPVYEIVVELNGGNGGGGTTTIYNESLSPINGSNATFITNENFVPGKIAVYSNGQRQTNGEDYFTIGTNQIQLMFSPVVGETLVVDYQKL